MSKYQMQCPDCEKWIDVPYSQLRVPVHGGSKIGDSTAKCTGNGKTALDVKGWHVDKRPPSIKKGTK